MATAPNVSFTKEKANFLRLCTAIIDLGTEVLRQILNKYVPPNSIEQAVKKSNLKLLPDQKTTLSTNNGNYKELDISLLYKLIRGLCTAIKPTRGWNPSYPPTATEVSLGDDVERIHFIRNKCYAHIYQTPVSDQAFQNYWKELEGLMARMDALFCSNFKQSMLDVEIDILDLEILKKGYLRDLNHHSVELWRKDGKSFFDTKASKKVKNVVKNNTFTVITGPPGSGKSAIAHHIATDLQDQDYEVVHVESVADLERSWVKGSKQVFVLDDVFGEHSLNTCEIESWNKRKERVKQCLQNNKIIVTMRKQYSWDKFILSLFSEYQSVVVDITQKELLLSPSEKRSIFKKHMFVAKKQSNCNDSVTNCEFSFFPLLCSLFAADNESKYDVHTFFKNSMSVLKKEFELLRENKDGKYLGLVLCVIYDNKLYASLLDVGEESKETKYLRKDFAECCGLSRSFSRKEIKQNLDSLLGTYVLKESGFYKFTHAIIYDVVVSTLTSEFQPSILKHCSSKFINQRVSLSSVHPKNDGIRQFIVLDEIRKQKWMDRLILDMTRGNYLDVFFNTCLKDETIEELFLNTLKKSQFGKNDFLKVLHCSENTKKQ